MIAKSIQPEIRIAIRAIELASVNRLPGYLAACEATARQDGEDFIFTADDYHRLRREFALPSEAPLRTPLPEDPSDRISGCCDRADQD